MIQTISDLTPDPKNARKRGPRAEGMLVSSLQEVGAARSIVIDENGRILAGNGTIQAAAEAGIERVTVVDCDGETIVAVRRTGLTEAQKKRLALLDNRTAELAEWDPIILAELAQEGVELNGLWSEDELTALLASVMEPASGLLDGADPDAIPENVETRCKPGDLWRLGEHRLLCGDSTKADDVARLMGGQPCEMVWTDPPYGVAIGDKNKFLNSIAPSNRVEENLENDTLDEDGLFLMLQQAFAHALAHCRAGGAWYVAAPAGPLHVLFGQAMKDLGVWRQTIQWVKNNATFSPLGVDYHWRAEPIFYGWAPGAAHRYYGGRKQDTVWEIDRPHASPEHPTMKPVELVRRAIENSSRPGEIVYDAFGGSGTTLIASEEIGRKARLIELSPVYADVILARYELATGKQAELVEHGKTETRD